MPGIIRNANNTTNLPGFYRRGIPDNFTKFGVYQVQNYGMLKQIVRHNVENRRPRFQFLT